MSDERIEKSMRSAAASVEMEGFHIENSYLDLCRRMLKGEITMEEYISKVTSRESA